LIIIYGLLNRTILIEKDFTDVQEHDFNPSLIMIYIILYHII